VKNAILWDVIPIALVRTEVSEEPSASIICVNKFSELGTLPATGNRRMLRPSVFLRSVRRLPVTANGVPSSETLVTLMMEALDFFES
jgi:hypothetical protein